MSTVALAGDWHGNTRWAVARIAEVAERGVELILHVGDFGIWPGGSGQAYLRRLEEACARHSVSTCVTPGNHEDWGHLTRAWSEPDAAHYGLRRTAPTTAYAAHRGPVARPPLRARGPQVRLARRRSAGRPRQPDPGQELVARGDDPA